MPRTLRRNYIHDLGAMGAVGTMGIYLDEEPLLPLGNVVRRNVAYRCKRWLSAHGMDKYLDRVQFSDNLTTDDDPGFVDAAKQDFRLREDCAVLKLPGGERIPIERIGLCKDEYRTN